MGEPAGRGSKEGSGQETRGERQQLQKREAHGGVTAELRLGAGCPHPSSRRPPVAMQWGRDPTCSWPSAGKPSAQCLAFPTPALPWPPTCLPRGISSGSLPFLRRMLRRVLHASRGPFQKLPGAHLTFPWESVYHPRLRQGSELQAYRFSHCTACPPGIGWTSRSLGPLPPRLSGARGELGLRSPPQTSPCTAARQGGWMGAGGWK